MTATTAASVPDGIWFLDNHARVHVRGEATGGAYAIVEMQGREGDMPPLHVHHRDDELFYVVDGRLSVHLPGRTVELSPGQSFLAPKGTPHMYRVESAQATWLVVTSPSGFERFVEEVGEAAKRPTLPPRGRHHDGELIAARASRHGIEVVGPPGTLPE